MISEYRALSRIENRLVHEGDKSDKNVILMRNGKIALKKHYFEALLCYYCILHCVRNLHALVNTFKVMVLSQVLIIKYLSVR